MNSTESDIVSYLIREFSPELILLGGSRSVHSERENSDWDLYLIGDYSEENERVFRNLNGAHLDIALFPRHMLKDRVLKIYYGPLKSLRPILDNDSGDAAAIALATQTAYSRGPKPISAERLSELTEEASRLLSKIESYSKEPSVSQFHMGFFYQLILPAWFEIRGEWSVPAHIAIPLIRRADPDFASLLNTFSIGDFTNRVNASRSIYELLFNNC